MVLTVVDLVLIMSVNPGFGGQSFIESQVKKISDLRRLCAEKVWFYICITVYYFLFSPYFYVIHNYICFLSPSLSSGSKSMD